MGRDTKETNDEYIKKINLLLEKMDLDKLKYYCKIIEGIEKGEE